jgi:hypothetical protein
MVSRCEIFVDQREIDERRSWPAVVIHARCIESGTMSRSPT